MIQILNIEHWNGMTHDAETECTASKGDACFATNGIICLIQTCGGFNNVIIEAEPDKKTNIILALKDIYKFLLENKMRYIRVEAKNSRKYDILEKIFNRPCCKDIDVESGRCVWYYEVYDEA